MPKWYDEQNRKPDPQNLAAAMSCMEDLQAKYLQFRDAQQAVADELADCVVVVDVYEKQTQRTFVCRCQLLADVENSSVKPDLERAVLFEDSLGEIDLPELRTARQLRNEIANSCTNNGGQPSPALRKRMDVQWQNEISAQYIEAELKRIVAKLARQAADLVPARQQRLGSKETQQVAAAPIPPVPFALPAPVAPAPIEIRVVLSIENIQRHESIQRHEHLPPAQAFLAREVRLLPATEPQLQLPKQAQEAP